MTKERSHAQHHGERRVQLRRHAPAELARVIPDYIHTEMPQQHAEFFAGLDYLPLATLDHRGRPWASILVTQSPSDPAIGIKVNATGGLQINSRVSLLDPFVRALVDARNDGSSAGRLFAGVGVDFSNRRRNKLAGTIHSAKLQENGQLIPGSRFRSTPG